MILILHNTLRFALAMIDDSYRCAHQFIALGKQQAKHICQFLCSGVISEF